MLCPTLVLNGEVQQTRPVLFRRDPIARSVTQVPFGHIVIGSQCKFRASLATGNWRPLRLTCSTSTLSLFRLRSMKFCVKRDLRSVVQTRALGTVATFNYFLFTKIFLATLSCTKNKQMTWIELNTFFHGESAVHRKTFWTSKCLALDRYPAQITNKFFPKVRWWYAPKPSLEQVWRNSIFRVTQYMQHSVGENNDDPTPDSVSAPAIPTYPRRTLVEQHKAVQSNTWNLLHFLQRNHTTRHKANSMGIGSSNSCQCRTWREFLINEYGVHGQAEEPTLRYGFHKCCGTEWVNTPPWDQLSVM